MSHLSALPLASPSLFSDGLFPEHGNGPIRRSAPFGEEPGFYEPAGLWLYGNVRLLHTPLACVEEAHGPPEHLPSQLDAVERQAEELVLTSKTLVCGIHSAAHMRTAVVPLRWGAPRLVVFSGGFLYHLGENLKGEPFRAARLWRYEWDSKTDLAVSRRSPGKKPTFARHNPTVDRLVAHLACGTWPGLSRLTDSLTPILDTKPI